MSGEKRSDDLEGIRYTFTTEWYDPDACVARGFYMFFFPADNTLELFDIKNNKTFLKRTKCDEVTLDSIHLGGTIKVYSRLMTVTGYGDTFTTRTLGIVKQRTFGILKPDVIPKMGEVFSVMQKHGFHITKLRQVLFTKEQAEDFLSNNAGDANFSFLVKYMISDSTVLMQIEGCNAVEAWAVLVGPDELAKAQRDAPSSLRAMYGTDDIHNAVFAPKSMEEADDLLKKYFPSTNKSSNLYPKPTPVLNDSTCCVVKPHAIKEGNFGEIVTQINKGGYLITAMQMFYLDIVTAEEFFEVYKGVVPEFSGMVDHIVSGPCIAMEITGYGADTHKKFRDFVGPADSTIAKQLRPHTLRAIYGKDKIQNAVHCTDLPDDTVLEVEYFFKILQ